LRTVGALNVSVSAFFTIGKLETRHADTTVEWCGAFVEARVRWGPALMADVSDSA